MLRKLDSSLWVNEVPFKLLGVDFGNKMTCIQLSTGELWLHSPTQFNQAMYDEISSMGKVKFLVTPSVMHNLFVMDWKAQDESSIVLAPSRAKKVKSDIKLNKISIEEIENMFNGEISCIPIKGLPVLNEYAFIHHGSKTLILTDIAFNFGDDVTGWKKICLKLYGAYNKFGPSISIRAFIKDKRAFGESLKQILAHDFDRIIVSHGDVVENNGKQVLHDAFEKYINYA